MNVCGVLVHLVPAKRAAAVAAIAAMPGLEIHAGADDGRLVVTFDDVDGPPVPDTLAALHTVDGVIAAALVYHAYEPGDETAPVQTEIQAGN